METHYIDHTQIAYLYWVNLSLLSLAGAFLLIKSLKFMALYVRFGAMSQTIARAIPGVLVQVLNFGVYYFAFGFMGYQLFGSRVEEFCTMGRTMSTMFMYTIGAFDYETIA